MSENLRGASACPPFSAARETPDTVDRFLAEIARVAEEITPGGSDKLARITILTTSEDFYSSQFTVALSPEESATALNRKGPDGGWVITRRQNAVSENEVFSVRDVTYSLDAAADDALGAAAGLGGSCEPWQITIARPNDKPLFESGPADLPLIQVGTWSTEANREPQYYFEYRADGLRTPGYFDGADMDTVLTDLEATARRGRGGRAAGQLALRRARPTLRLWRLHVLRRGGPRQDRHHPPPGALPPRVRVICKRGSRGQIERARPAGPARPRPPARRDPARPASRKVGGTRQKGPARGGAC